MSQGCDRIRHRSPKRVKNTREKKNEISKLNGGLRKMKGESEQETGRVETARERNKTNKKGKEQGEKAQSACA